MAIHHLVASLLLFFSCCHAVAAGAGVRGRLPPTLANLAPRLDHFNELPASNGTFRQRYLVNGTFWGGAAAPVFVYAGNEGDVALFASNTGFMWEAAPRFRAMLVFVEHRYYGESLPFGGTRAAAFADASAAGYLTTAQALADFAELILSLKSNLTACKAPVVIFGGSYGGINRSGLFRSRTEND
ncbi:hypothetical protein OsJ_33022 [Oryza sativa Japonica Group]|uniref:Uncharacterized protein n=1 Tax=Oryza sativa subsp. japonica TaxID=39947 RepID=B9G9G8_ORYSJ|nr:hypothetical protein OsJ_33022 [Oryza sativa Japonica Group]